MPVRHAVRGPVIIPIAYTILGPITFVGNVSGFSGFTIRQLFKPVDLAPAPLAIARAQVTFQFESLSNGNIVSAYIGNLTGSNQNYDGNQVQLLFGGSAGATISGSTPIVSDKVPFTYNPPAAGIAVSMGLGGATVTTRNTGSTFHAGTDEYFLSGNSHAGDTSFSGTLGQSAAIASIVQIDIFYG